MPNKTAWENLRVYLFFLASALICLWPLTLAVFTFKNDALTYYYPVRTLISDALNNGELPLWTPYINLGYPLHADFQSGAWNPIVWILSLTTRYPLWAMHLELMIYLSIAVYGMYKLSVSRGASCWIAIVCGLSFEFSGFMLDSTQFFTAVSSACWVPLIFLHFNKMLHNGTMKNAALLALNLSLLILCGYPAFFIITIYLLLFYLIYFAWTKRKTKYIYGAIFLRIGLAVFLFLAFCLPAIISFYQHLPFISRGEGQLLSVVQENSMNPATLVSFLFPFSSQAHNLFLGSEPLMRTIYMGILPVCLFVVLLVNGALKNTKNLLLLAASITMLLLAFGKYFFLRELAYHFLPGMNLFRHPGLFRLFFIFFFLFLIAGAFRMNELNMRFLKKAALGIFVFSIASLIISLIITASNHQLNYDMLRPGNFMGADFWQRMIPESISVLLISFLLHLSIRNISTTKYGAEIAYSETNMKKSGRSPGSFLNLKYLFIVFFLDILISTQFHLPVTVIGAKHYSQVVNDLDRNPEKFPQPGNNSLARNSINSVDEEFEAGSRMPFRKMVGRNDYFITPGNLTTQDSFYKSPIRDSIMEKPLVSMVNQNGHIRIEKMGANFIEGNLNAADNDEVLYLQNRYPNWQVFIDGKKKEIQPAAISFMMVRVEKGSHHFRFSYAPPYLKWAIWFPLTGLLILLWIIFSRDRRAKHQKEIARPA